MVSLEMEPVAVWPDFKGVVRSKISCGYVKVDGLGETLLITQTKSDKNWLRYGASNTTRSKHDFWLS